MTKRYLAALALLIVAGCGVDGEPVRPSLGTTIGVSSGGGVRATTNVGAVLGNVNVGVGVGL
ncbi:MAG: argininosuccinate lyase [Roseovarius sp.]|nr:argininosuccinate lyase [Roseovarius sp.]